ncbi:gamma carbonic anhydrase family protein [Inmirania thermothiophila]|uniref:Carbonic anhydrase/acetyltransferase-like protein (Isoleucine patch superfamily) n=1 Tax=Inmirania thermothiophila TaxID=1750597 RepID=A0A3N1YAE2_9GAMM|nr:gamma carbonic anhydrase family protein [Inmirania thermothiophila]ROR34367.1 carbonic anhydrase/acetyltransferase-like protein (isoleucine patch superfamily) [Inmirania thermothiophila]
MTVAAFAGRSPRIDPEAFVHPLAYVVGDVTVGAASSLWPGVVARGDVHAIRIGRRTNVQDGTVLHVTGPHGDRPGHPLAIGDEVTIGHRAVVHGCTVGSRVLVGIGAIVLDGAVIEDEVIVGAGALVPPGARLASGHLYLGCPARAARPLRADEREGLARSAEHYVALARRHAEVSAY